MKHVVSILCVILTQAVAGEAPATLPEALLGRTTALSQILGRPTDRAVSLSLLSATDIEAYVEYGTAAQPFAQHTPMAAANGTVPVVVEIGGLARDTAYSYRLRSRRPGETDYAVGPTYAFRTQRAPGSTFTFALQGDSHPEREGKMFNTDLYVETMRLVAKDRPDFYIMLGDDFSIERLIQRQTLSQGSVDQVYALQRSFLGMIGTTSALFLVNGNHEQAGRHWLDGTPNNPAVLAGHARTTFFALPAPDAFYSGDPEEVQHVGLLRDYYAWTWGDALFVVIDPYWHSPIEVDHDGHGDKGGKGGKGGKGKKQGGNAPADGPAQGDPPPVAAGSGPDPAPPGAKRDLWQVTMGDAQYHWLHDTLTNSKARWKFVFAHHVMGTGRGGIEEARLYEWGGRDRNGASLFAAKRPGWDLPIHDLFVKSGVTIFFQGHDHIFARQELDGVIYQSTPNPADNTYQAFNRDAYTSGDVFPNSGHLRVTVATDQVRVDYIRSFLPADQNADRMNGAVAFTYAVPMKKP